jgi:hypothetical protein
MRISNGFLSGLRIDRPNDIDPGQASTARTGPVAQQDAGNDSSVNELAQLVTALNGTEEIRSGLVEEVARRLVSGYYSTAEAAERTATAILKSAS